jgi:ethanolamine-phosphate cytidylyltransferase
MFFFLAEACKWVDEIHVNAPYDPTIELIDSLNCSHCAHGDDLIIGPNGEDAYKPFKDANRMKIFKRTEGVSTTDIVGKLLLMTREKD